MPQEPKKRHSKARQGKRRASIHLNIQSGVLCANCANIILPHSICRFCGYYAGKVVLAIKTKEKKNENPS